MRTSSDGLQRLARQPGFTGSVQPGENYVLVDDTLTQGGTFAQLKEFIALGGGKVLAAFALTGKQYLAKIKPMPTPLPNSDKPTAPSSPGGQPSSDMALTDSQNPKPAMSSSPVYQLTPCEIDSLLREMKADLQVLQQRRAQRKMATSSAP